MEEEWLRHGVDHTDASCRRSVPFFCRPVSRRSVLLSAFRNPCSPGHPRHRLSRLQSSAQRFALRFIVARPLARADPQNAPWHVLQRLHSDRHLPRPHVRVPPLRARHAGAGAAGGVRVLLLSAELERSEKRVSRRVSSLPRPSCAPMRRLRPGGPQRCLVQHAHRARGECSAPAARGSKMWTTRTLSGQSV